MRYFYDYSKFLPVQSWLKWYVNSVHRTPQVGLNSSMHRVAWCCLFNAYLLRSGHKGGGGVYTVQKYIHKYRVWLIWGIVACVEKGKNAKCWHFDMLNSHPMPPPPPQPPENPPPLPATAPWARIFKLLNSPGIYSQESIPGILGLSYRPARLHRLAESTPWNQFLGSLKGLSHEIDFDNVDENWQMLALTRTAAGFWIFRRHLWFLVEIKHLLSGKC